jgi:hypothetical protein
VVNETIDEQEEEKGGDYNSRRRGRGQSRGKSSQINNTSNDITNNQMNEAYGRELYAKMIKKLYLEIKKQQERHTNIKRQRPIEIL